MYQLTATTNTIKRLSDGAIIPENITLNDWAEYQDWLRIPNNAPLPVTPPSKEEIWAKIKAKRDFLTLEGGCKVGEHWFLSTERARGEYTSMVIVTSGAPPSYVIVPNWRTMKDGVVVDMTVSLVKQILTAGLTQAAAIDIATQGHRAAMEASETPWTYDFSQGWPASFTSELP